MFLLELSVICFLIIQMAYDPIEKNSKEQNFLNYHSLDLKDRDMVMLILSSLVISYFIFI